MASERMVDESSSDLSDFDSDSESDVPSAPWHFKLLLIALVIYLVYRGVQLSIWAYQQVF